MSGKPGNVATASVTAAILVLVEAFIVVTGDNKDFVPAEIWDMDGEDAVKHATQTGFPGIRPLLIKFFYAEHVPDPSALLTLISSKTSLQRASSKSGVYYYTVPPSDTIHAFSHMKNEGKPGYKGCRLRNMSVAAEVDAMKAVLAAPNTLPACMLKPPITPANAHELVKATLEKITMVPAPKPGPKSAGKSAAAAAGAAGSASSGVGTKRAPDRELRIPLSPSKMPANTMARLSNEVHADQDSATVVELIMALPTAIKNNCPDWYHTLTTTDPRNLDREERLIQAGMIMGDLLKTTRQKENAGPST